MDLLGEASSSSDEDDDDDSDDEDGQRAGLAAGDEGRDAGEKNEEEDDEDGLTSHQLRMRAKQKEIQEMESKLAHQLRHGREWQLAGEVRAAQRP